MKPCDYCGRPTDNPKYCSSSCSASVNNKIPKRKAKVNLCFSCGTPAPPRRKYCQTCYEGRVEDLTLAEAMYGHLHKSSAFAKVRTRARASVKDWPQICAECGYSKHVECCHVKAVKDFSLDTPISVVNHPDNLILLCPNCHWEYDHPD